MFFQKEIKLRPFTRGFHLITNIITAHLPEITLVHLGFLQVFVKHTSASLTINENCDPTVRGDFERHFNILFPEKAPHYQHDYQGDDDMPAHLKSSTLGCQVMIPITNGKLNLGTWQGIYFCEHRNYDQGRSLVLTIMGE